MGIGKGFRGLFVVVALLAVATSSTEADSIHSWLVKDIKPGPIASNPQAFVEEGKYVFFNTTGQYGFGAELWRTDGTEAGTILLTSHGSYSIYEGSPKPLGLNGRVFFDKYVTGTTNGLWVSDGTSSGTRPVVEFDPSDFGGNVRVKTAVNNRLLFTVDMSRLYATDGTAAGTTLLRDFSSASSQKASYTGKELLGILFDFIPMGNNLYFRLTNGSQPGELWRTNGTPEGTVLVKSFDSGSLGLLSASESLLLLQYRPNGANGWELWRSDGTLSGTFKLLQLPETVYTANVLDSCYFKGFFHFGVAFRPEIWRSDGSSFGTGIWLALEGAGIPDQVPPHGFRVLDDRVFFLYSTVGTGEELWVSDGTVEGTHILKDIAPGAASGAIGVMGTMGNDLLFRANDGSGPKLWASDGTEAGTRVLLDVDPGYGEFAESRDAHFMSSSDDTHGAELWAFAEGEFRFLRQPRARGNYEENDPLNLEVEVPLWAQNSAQYQWFRNGVEIEDATGAAFNVSFLRLAHEGRYFCRVTLPGDSKGEYDSESTYVRVYPEGSLPLTTPLAIVFIMTGIVMIGLRALRPRWI